MRSVAILVCALPGAASIARIPPPPPLAPSTDSRAVEKTSVPSSWLGSAGGASLNRLRVSSPRLTLGPVSVSSMSSAKLNAGAPSLDYNQVSIQTRNPTARPPPKKKHTHISTHIGTHEHVGHLSNTSHAFPLNMHPGSWGCPPLVFS